MCKLLIFHEINEILQYKNFSSLLLKRIGVGGREYKPIKNGWVKFFNCSVEKNISKVVGLTFLASVK